MKKLLFTLLVLFSSQHMLTYAQSENSDNKNIEQSISYSWVYAMNLLDFNVPNCNEFAISYTLDYNLPNTSLFFEIGASLGYSYHEMNDAKVHAPYIGVPLGIGFHINTGNLRVSPFFRLTPFVTKYLGKNDYCDINDTDFGGAAPEIGATFNLRNITLTASIPMFWDTDWMDYSRCGQTGLRIGVGFPF